MILIASAKLGATSLYKPFGFCSQQAHSFCQWGALGALAKLRAGSHNRNKVVLSFSNG
jgi:hypothetical protein